MLIALGSNASHDLDDAAAIILKAMSGIEKEFGQPAKRSRFFRTPAFPAGAGPDFVNAAIRIVSDESPPEILEILHRIEAEAGRVRTVRWGQRCLDLDLIAVGNIVLPDNATHQYWRGLPFEKQVKLTPDQLILPHPRLQDRSFVLVPLADVAPDWVHPILGKTVLEMRDARPWDEIESVQPI